MATLPLTCQLLVDGSWQVYPGYTEEGWSAQIGPDADAGSQPNRLEFTLASDDLAMDPSNAASTLYGKIGRNTPARLQVSGITITQAEASVWKPQRTPEHVPSAGRGRSWVTVTAEGLLRRLGQWDDPIDSPMRRQIGLYPSLTGYWPLEDPSGATLLANVVPGGIPGTYSGSVTLGGNDGAGGSDKSIEVGSTATLTGVFRTPTGSGYQVCFSADLATLPASATYGTLFSWVDTAGRTFSWQWNNTTYRTIVTDTDGTVLDASAIGVQPILTWTRYRVRVTVSGGTVTYEPAWYTQDSPVTSGITATFPGTSTGRPKVWNAYGNSFTDGSSFSHVFAITDTSFDLLSADAANIFNGYPGEPAASRWYRLLGEAGLTRYVNGTGSASAPMGRQKSGRLLDLLEECARTDGGLMYDEPLDIALTLLCNNYLINRPIAFNLTLNTNVAPPLIKDISDAGIVNDVTGQNADGSEYRLERTTGRLSTSPPPAGAGRYKKTLATNTASAGAQLVDRVAWELANGTIDRPRYREVRVDLLANPGLRTSINSLRPGDLITLTGAEPDVLTLRVMTIAREGDAVRDTAILTCVPGDVWRPGKYNDGVVRYDSESTTLKAAATAGATAVTFRTADVNDLWSTTGVPYDVMIAGQRNTVTAMGAAALVSGSYDQAATLTRGVNGITKALTAGAPINIATPGRWAL